MKNTTKYKLYRTVATLTIVSTLATGISAFAGNQQKEVIPYTQADLNSNIIFAHHLEQIMNETQIEFKNEELKELIEEKIGGPITKESLATLDILSINRHLNNNDFSDLKYLTNLQSILIYDNIVNLQDLQYNQNLYSIILNTCIVSNSEYLPNSTELVTLDYCTYEGEEFIVPYYTSELDTKSTIINNIKLKNPAYLKKISLYTDSIIDLDNLRGCTNLKELSLLRISNVKNADALRWLTNLEKVELDEYATIWLDIDTLNTLPLPKMQKERLGTQIKYLDKLSTSIVSSNSSIDPEYKARAITLYLLDNYDYDFSSVENYEIDSSGVTDYNDKPISTILEEKKGVCINYACMFTALANRAGLDNCQLFNKVHTWNSVNTEDGYICYDLSYLESGSIVKIDDMESLALIQDVTPQEMIRDNKGNHLYYYEFDIDKIIDDNHIADYTPQELKETVLNIGYINDNSIVRLIEKNEIKLYKMNTFLKSYLIMLLLTLGLQAIIDKVNKKEEYEYEEEIKVLQK